MSKRTFYILCRELFFFFYVRKVGKLFKPRTEPNFSIVAVLLLSVPCCTFNAFTFTSNNFCTNFGNSKYEYCLNFMYDFSTAFLATPTFLAISSISGKSLRTHAIAKKIDANAISCAKRPFASMFTFDASMQISLAIRSSCSFTPFKWQNLDMYSIGFVIGILIVRYALTFFSQLLIMLGVICSGGNGLHNSLKLRECPTILHAIYNNPSINGNNLISSSKGIDISWKKCSRSKSSNADNDVSYIRWLNFN